jgi:F-type H+-transporting ATPase subunit b
MEHQDPSFFSWTLLWSFINFTILVGLLAYFFTKPLRKFLANRHQELKDEIEGAEGARRKAQQSYEDYQKKLAEIEQEMVKLRSSFQEEGERERKVILEEAERSGRRIRKEAQEIAEGELQRVRKLLQDEAAELTVKIAEGILKKEINYQDQERLIKDYLERMGEQSR